jgi:hypothetical protein
MLGANDGAKAGLLVFRQSPLDCELRTAKSVLYNPEYCSPNPMTHDH